MVFFETYMAPAVHGRGRLRWCDKRRIMRLINPCVTALAALLIGTLVGCSNTTPKSPDVSDAIRKSLDERADLKDVSIKQRSR